MKKPTCFFLVGLPGAGKSTWVEKNHPSLPIVSRDIIRAKLGYIKEGEKAVLSKEAEQHVTEVENQMIRDLCDQGQDFCLDDTNTTKFYRNVLLETVRMAGANRHIVFIDTPLEECIKRRQGQIPEAAMRNIAKRFERPLPMEGENYTRVPF